MANECNNYLVITGPADEIERFVRSTTRIVKLLDGTMSTQPCFCFEALVPAPSYYTADWACENWGCKYDIDYLGITIEAMQWHKGCQKIRLIFATPWDPPRKWLIQASKAYPKLYFKMESADYLRCWKEDYFAKAGRMRRKKYTDAECWELFKSYWGE